MSESIPRDSMDATPRMVFARAIAFAETVDASKSFAIILKDDDTRQLGLQYYRGGMNAMDCLALLELTKAHILKNLLEHSDPSPT